MRLPLPLLLVLLAFTACSDPAPGQPDAAPPPDAAPLPDAAPPDAAVPGTCPAGPAGLACLLGQWDGLAACAPAEVAAFRASLVARHGDLPAWHDGRALFVTFGGPAGVAGEWNTWDPAALVTAQVCGSDVYVAEAAVASGRYAYKLVDGDTWSLDPENWAFAFDAYAGNADGKNSVLNTHDSGLGHLVQPDAPLCSEALGNCRPFTTYLPPGYGAPANADRTYPVIYMHDGQNLYDDTDCCFGHTGWEVNVLLDQEIAAGTVEPAVVVGFDHAGDLRGDEYAYAVADGGELETFMEFQVTGVQPTAEALWRLDPDRRFVAGSSFGGHVSLRLAFAYPTVYRAAVSLSGAFWPGMDTGHALRDVIEAQGQVPVAIYQDHGGTTGDEDGLTENVEVRDLLVAAGWTLQTSPDCTFAPDVLCYHHEVGATHDELAWKDRSWRWVRFLLAQ